MKTELTTFHGCGDKALAAKLMAAHERGLTVREITHGINGYPAPFHGEFFISGFDDISAARAFAEANGGVVGSADWRDGWGCVEKFSDDDRPLMVPEDLPAFGKAAREIKDSALLVADELANLRERLAELPKIVDEDDDDGAEDRRFLARKIAQLEACNPASILVGDDLYEAGPHMDLSYDVMNRGVGVLLTEAAEAEADEADADDED